MEKSYHILVIDDDTRLRNLLGKFLDENGFFVSLAENTSEARKLMREFLFDLLIVDVMMPEENGIDFTKSFRSDSKIPIIILTARGEITDRITGLEVGADDYLPKPFEPKELLLRIHNILKRTSATNSINNNACSFGEFNFDLQNGRLKKNNESVHLTESEAKILKVLCKEQGSTISRDRLAEICGVDARSIDVQITRLRKKIEKNPKQPNYLQTIRNKGYVLYS